MSLDPERMSPEERGFYYPEAEKGGGTAPAALLAALGVLPKALEPLEQIAKLMSTSKFEKAAKETKGMFEKISGASLQTTVLMKMFEVLEPLLGLFEPFQVALDIIKGLFEALVGEALKPMFDAMQPVYDVLLSLTPVFKLIGGAIGVLIQLGMIPLSLLFELLGAVLKPLMPLLEPLIEALGGFSDEITIWVSAIGDILDLNIKKWFKDIIKWWNKLFGLEIEEEEEKYEGLTKGEKRRLAGVHRLIEGITDLLPDFPFSVGGLLMAEGGYIPPRVGGTLATIGEGGVGEHVTPDSDFKILMNESKTTNNMLADLIGQNEQLIRIQSQTLAEKRWKHKKAQGGGRWSQ